MQQTTNRGRRDRSQKKKKKKKKKKQSELPDSHLFSCGRVFDGALGFRVCKENLVPGACHRRLRYICIEIMNFDQKKKSKRISFTDQREYSTSADRQPDPIFSNNTNREELTDSLLSASLQ